MVIDSRVKARPHLLGEVTAENDRLLLNNFFETPEYRSLLESSDHTVVVGRRGTGKSALFKKLHSHWDGLKSNIVISITPDDHHTIGMRALFKRFNNKYQYIRAASKLFWKYAFMMEISSEISKGYKGRQAIASSELLLNDLRFWQSDTSEFFSKFIKKSKSCLPIDQDIDDSISSISSILGLTPLEREFIDVVDGSTQKIYLLVDRLDEGYEDDAVGAAIVAGAILAVSELNKKVDKLRPILFQRDSVHRNIAKLDPDYTRNIESEVLRLHWDTHQLLNLVAKRMNVVFGLKLENAQRIWDRCTADIGPERELKGSAGFKKCLQFTLYRPRDLMSLLNQAFYNASRENRDTITLDDIESTAKIISQTRLDDLIKEYQAIFPSISAAVRMYANNAPDITYADALLYADSIINDQVGWADDPEISTDIAILGNDGIVRALFSVGFIGIHDLTSNAYIFCHDGRNPDREINQSDKLLVHPCYWISLNLTKNALKPEESAFIDDEYEITVKSVAPELRARKIEQLTSEISTIPTGADGATRFEDWVYKVAQTVFAGHLDNFEKKPNRLNVQRRDIVATNLEKSTAWARIGKDYFVRQVVFEVKNYSNIGADEYRQMSTYLNQKYGSLGFIVTRDEDEQPRSGKDLDWVKELHDTENKLVIKLSYKFFIKTLNKLRNPEKHDAVNHALNQLLDSYERIYLSNKSSQRNFNSRSKIKRPR